MRSVGSSSMSLSSKNAVQNQNQNQNQNQTSSVRPIKKWKGSHMFRIMGYSLDKETAQGQFLESPIFNVGGHDWSIQYYPNGTKSATHGDISLFLVLKSQAHGVKVQVSFSMLDQTGSALLVIDIPDAISLSGLGDYFGFPTFVTRRQLAPKIKDDCLIIQCVIAVIKVFPVEPTELVVVPPDNISQQLGHLLESGIGADVTFQVDGKAFHAHKCVLAARSLVFLAQLFGPMKEKSDNVIKIEEINAPVFKSLLHFIYNGSIPELQETLESEEEEVGLMDQRLLGENDTYGVERLFSEETIESAEEQDAGSILAQHLLVAADRYGLERLKIMCEKILCESIDKSSVVNLLALAERHSCNHLKTSCLKFLVTANIFGDVIETDEFQQLMKNYHTSLTE